MKPLLPLIFLTLHAVAAVSGGRQPLPPPAEGVATGGGTVAAAARARQQWAQRLRERVDSLAAAPMFHTSLVGIGVYDITADSLVYQRNIRQTMRPASTAKVLTAIAALHQLGGAFRFETSLYADGEISDSVLLGSVYVRAGMDPMFGHDDMRALATSLRTMGVDSIAGGIITDTSIKDSLKWGSGWCWDDAMPPLRALLYNGRDTFMPEFLHALGKAGIRVGGKVSEGLVANAPLARRVAARHHTIGQILAGMLKESDNTCAEALFYQLGAQDGVAYAEAGRAANRVKAMTSLFGLDPSHYVVADGSGVSLYNYASPELLLEALVFARRRQNIFDHLYPALPVAGADGTLARRMRGTAAQRNVRAKTGTLKGVSALAGYATSSEGHELAFAIFNSGTLSDKAARAFQDSVCRALTE